MDNKVIFFNKIMVNDLTSYNINLKKNLNIKSLNVEEHVTLSELTVKNNLIMEQGEIQFTSDETLKTNIKNIENPIQLLENINGVTFNWKSNIKSNIKSDIKSNIKSDIKNKKEYGLIAQEVEKILPELVNEEENNIKNVNYIKFIPILIQSINYQQKQINELQKQINELQKTK